MGLSSSRTGSAVSLVVVDLSDDALYSLATADTPGREQVGGKGASLIAMTRAGLPVPPGVVLTTAFFYPWGETLRNSTAWSAFAEAVNTDKPSDEELRKRTADLQGVCEGLSLTEAQQQSLSAALKELPGSGHESEGELVAVRSSAPQEDLAGAAFAGVYESVLGVAPGGLARAVRAVFVSALDFKAVSYKRQRGFDPTDVEIAVVVQQQLDSASAGVAFSLNPQTNDYDQAAIQANRGLGETVVSGSVTPDQFIVDKVAERILDRKLGAKETALWSRPEDASGTKPDEHSRDNQRWALTDGQAGEIARLAQRVESLTAAPVDIEWAYTSEGTLWLLQARPVTTYFPLPEELRTAAGAPRRLYMDSTLLEEGLQEPLSVLGARWMEDGIVAMIHQMTGREVPTRASDGLVLTVGGRWYANVSNLLWLGTERLARSLETLDVHAAQVMRNVDAQYYRRAATTKPTAAAVARTVVGVLSHSAGPVGRVIVALAAPEWARRHYEATVDQHRRHLAEVVRTVRSMPQLGERTVQPAIRLLMRESLPLTYAAEAATALLQLLYRRARCQQRQRLETALRSMPHNTTIEMGLALYDLARTLEEYVGKQAYSDLPALARYIEHRQLPEPVLDQWDAFMDAYGFRGPNELDLAAPRYADEPRLVLEQMRQLVRFDEATQENPQQAYERRQRERRAAYRGLLHQTRNPVKRWLATRLYRSAEAFSGFREIHKYELVRAGYQVRRRALESGGALADGGRLDSAGQIFDLSYEDLADASTLPEPDLRERARCNTRYRRQLQRMAQARFPVMVDSRGYIPHPAPQSAGPGVLVGHGVSPGMTSGPAKVLSYVGEKPVLPGEILIARAADPGWTPLFVHAAGIVLETGGSFQHGALVAREYGKPCLVGIEDATQQVSDGHVVKLDGTAGTLTIESGSANDEG